MSYVNQYVIFWILIKEKKNVFATDKTNTIQPNSNWLQGCILKDKKLAMGLKFFILLHRDENLPSIEGIPSF